MELPEGISTEDLVDALIADDLRQHIEWDRIEREGNIHVCTNGEKWEKNKEGWVRVA